MISPHRLFTRVAPAAIAAFVILSAVAPPREADAQPGIRLGVTDDPDSFFFGFSYAIALTGGRNGVFVLEPGFDLGVGDGPVDLLLRGTAHFKYLIPIGRARDFVIYPLVGPDFVHIEFDGAGDSGEVGVDLGFGMGFKNFTFELWAGLSDIPDLTLAFGFHF